MLRDKEKYGFQIFMLSCIFACISMTLAMQKMSRLHTCIAVCICQTFHHNAERIPFNEFELQLDLMQR